MTAPVFGAVLGPARARLEAAARFADDTTGWCSEVAGVGGAIAVLGAPWSERRVSFDRPTLHRGGVHHPHVVAPLAGARRPACGSASTSCRPACAAACYSRAGRAGAGTGAASAAGRTAAASLADVPEQRLQHRQRQRLGVAELGGDPDGKAWRLGAGRGGRRQHRNGGTGPKQREGLREPARRRARRSRAGNA
jgi:hypothetical protein